MKEEVEIRRSRKKGDGKEKMGRRKKKGKENSNKMDGRY
jgi:hypothetical protein